MARHRPLLDMLTKLIHMNLKGRDKSIANERKKYALRRISRVPSVFLFRISLTSALESEFSTDEVYLDKIRNLSAKFSDIRRTRPDGNCFFRYEQDEWSKYD